MSDINKKNDPLMPSYNKTQVVNRLSELKSKYQSLVSELNGSSIENIDKVFGYSLDNDDIDSDLFINKINENLEIQDKIRILKQNIATKIKNIEKINSLNIDKKSYIDLKNQISKSFDLFNEISNENQNHNKNIASQSAVDTEILLKKINDMQKAMDERFSKLSNNLNVKDEAIYKDEIGFLKTQIDDLLVENREYKAKLSELISINNSKEDEINQSYNAWMRNSSKLNDLESLLMLQKEQIDSLDFEKNEIIDSLADKIKNIRTENDIYDQFYEDVSSENSSNVINQNLINEQEKNNEILNLIDTKLSNFKDEILSNTTNNEVNSGFNLDEKNIQLNDKNLKFISEKLSEIIANKKTDILTAFVDNLELILNRYKELSSMLDDEIGEVLKSVVSNEVEPSIDIDNIKYDLKNIDELGNDNFIENSENVYESLKNIVTIDDFIAFLNEASQSLNLLDNKATSSKLYIEKNIKENNRFLIDKQTWNKFHELLGKILIELDTMLAIIKNRMPAINKISKGAIIESNISKSNFWYCFMEGFDILNELLDEQKDKMTNTDDDISVMEIIKSKIDDEIAYDPNWNQKVDSYNSSIKYEHNEINEFEKNNYENDYSLNPFDALKEVEKDLKIEMNDVMKNDSLSLESKNKKLKLIVSKLNRLEKIIDMYEVNEFEKFVDTL